VRTQAYEVRLATAADAEGIAAAHLDSIHSLGPVHYPGDVVRDWAARIHPDIYLSAMDDGEIFYIAVAESDGKCEVLGFASHNVSADQHRTAVYVRGKVSRRGVGAALFRAAEAVALTRGATSIHVDASLAAVEFYRAQGFREVSRGDHQLWSGRMMPCVFMRKDLGPADASRGR